MRATRKPVRQREEKMRRLKIIFLGHFWLLCWLTAHGANEPRVASTASGWIDIGNEGTRFYDNPQALCPRGILRYEGDAEITCSNNAGTYGVWAFACPIGYLPDGYPNGSWASKLIGPYGLAPDGSVALGVGPGGPKFCFLNASNALPQLTLSGLSEVKPSGLSGYADLQLIAKVTKGNAPTANVPVNFAIDVVANTGSHEHHDNSRPSGNLYISNSSTDAYGEIKIGFKAPDVSGTHTITATCSTCQNQSVRMDIHVKVPDLLPISPNPPRNSDGSYAYALTSVDKTHAGNGRYHHHQYYLTDFSRKNLRSLINAFSEEGWGTVALNDASLAWGGRYDIRSDWKSPHAGHRDGREIDISFTRAQNPISTGKQKSFYKKFCEEKAVQIPFSILHHYALNPHFHVYLEKQTGCWLTEK